MLNIIVGKRSNLSQKLASKIKNCTVISSSSISEELEDIDWHAHEQVNLILNQFQPATKLNDLTFPTEYIANTIGDTASILEFIKVRRVNVNKIIYTSSSSIYGNNESCHENDTPAPINLHATLKAANERLVIKFCQDMSIDYTIARIFNMYGGEDRFSVVSKIISSFQNNKILTLVNDGKSIRDFIYIDDVVNTFKEILLVKNLPIINIASGKGSSVASILNLLKDKSFIVEVNNIILDEISVSVADNSKLISILGDYRFKDIDKYILECIDKS